MHAPPGFRRWRFHWFECSACGHRAPRAFANATMARAPLRIAWRFWCERCGSYSAPAKPMMPKLVAAIALLFIGPLAFAAIYHAISAGLRFEWLVLIFAAFWMVQPLLLLASTRLIYRYVPAK